jgi:hypothetical protein
LEEAMEEAGGERMKPPPGRFCAMAKLLRGCQDKDD